VEDNEYMLDILGNSLKRLGFSRIQKFKNGKDAVKFSPANGKIEVTASYAQGDSLNVSVADNGPGIEPAILRRLGEPFLQGNPAISQSGQGTGLGLSICKRYMDLLGGKLVIDSTLDRGTIATLRFTNTSLSDTR